MELVIKDRIRSIGIRIRLARTVSREDDGVEDIGKIN